MMSSIEDTSLMAATFKACGTAECPAFIVRVAAVAAAVFGSVGDSDVVREAQETVDLALKGACGQCAS